MSSTFHQDKLLRDDLFKYMSKEEQALIDGKEKEKDEKRERFNHRELNLQRRHNTHSREPVGRNLGALNKIVVMEG